MINPDNLPVWLIPRPGETFPQGYVECAIKANQLKEQYTEYVPRRMRPLASRTDLLASFGITV